MQPLSVFVVENPATGERSVADRLGECAWVRVAGRADNEGAAIASLVLSSVDCRLVIVQTQLRSGSGWGLLRDRHARRQGRCFVLLDDPLDEQTRRRASSFGVANVFHKDSDWERLLELCRGLADPMSMSLDNEPASLLAPHGAADSDAFVG
jgi:DNA-binding NarL/FixJ family response regulator